MDRRAVARALSSAVALPLALHEEAEAELASAREEVAQLRAALAQRDASIGRMQAETGDRCKKLFDDLAEYERTVADLRTKLREEESRRARYQAGHSAAVRFVRRFRAENPQSGWQAGWRCPIAEMKDLLAALPDDSPPGG